MEYPEPMLQGLAVDDLQLPSTKVVIRSSVRMERVLCVLGRGVRVPGMVKISGNFVKLIGRTAHLPWSWTGEKEELKGDYSKPFRELEGMLRSFPYTKETSIKRTALVRSGFFYFHVYEVYINAQKPIEKPRRMMWATQIHRVTIAWYPDLKLTKPLGWSSDSDSVGSSSSDDDQDSGLDLSSPAYSFSDLSSDEFEMEIESSSSSSEEDDELPLMAEQELNNLNVEEFLEALEVNEIIPDPDL